MKLLSLPAKRLGLVTEKGILLLPKGLAQSIKELIEGGEKALAQVHTYSSQATDFVAETSLGLGPCVPDLGKIVCVGLNYHRHAAEAGMAVTKMPIRFSKYSNSLAARIIEIEKLGQLRNKFIQKS